jgi:hypothetical protein
MITPDAAAIALLRTIPQVTALTGTRISTDYQPGPASIRVTLLPGGAAAQETWRAAIQVECWATDQITAGQLAAAVRRWWPTLRGTIGTDTWCAGAWIETNPSWVPDPESDRPRYILTAGLLLGDRP